MLFRSGLFLFALLGIWGLGVLGRPSDYRFAMRESYNERGEHEQFGRRLDQVYDRLQSFYGQFKDVQKETFGQLDQLTSVLSSQNSIDRLKEFFKNKLSQKLFEEKIAEVVKQKLQRVSDDKEGRANLAALDQRWKALEVKDRVLVLQKSDTAEPRALKSLTENSKQRRNRNLNSTFKNGRPRTGNGGSDKTSMESGLNNQNFKI